jgi:3-hydroxybutyryl-CoA dehydrogenase
MGAGIAHVFALHGHEVLLNDVDEARIARGIDGIAARLDREVEKGRLTAAERGRVLEHIDARPHFHDLEVDLAIEAASEDLGVKRDLLRRLDENTAPETIIATNTSSLSITLLGAGTSKPDRVIGMHFMNPVPVMPLVEVIRGLATSDATTHTIVELARALGKTLADFIGLDTVLAILTVLQDGLGDPKYRPCPLLRSYVAAGWLGKKTGRGFFDYRTTA